MKPFLVVKNKLGINFGVSAVKYFLFLLLTAVLFPVDAGEPQTSVRVEVEQVFDDNDSQAIVRNKASAKAALEGIERLPAVLIGKEEMFSINGELQNYTSDIKAVMAGQVDVLTVNEQWIDNRLILTADVRLDYGKTVEIITSLRDDAKARRALKRIYDSLADEIEKGAKNASWEAASVEFEGVVYNHFSGLNHNEALELKERKRELDALTESYQGYYDKFLPLWETVQVAVSDVQEDFIVLDVLASPDRAKEFYDNRSNGQTCIVRSNYNPDYTYQYGVSTIKLPARLIIYKAGLPSWRKANMWLERVGKREMSFEELKYYESDYFKEGVRLTGQELNLTLDSLLANPKRIFDYIGFC